MQEGSRGPCGVGFGGLSKNGAKPLGWEQVLNGASLNHANYWLSSNVFFAYGVMVPRGKISTDTMETRLQKISNVYPVNDKTKALGVALLEKEHLRGFTLFGDDDDIARLWASMYLGEANVRMFDIRSKAVCWTGSGPGSVFVPYIDIDEKGMKDDFERVFKERFQPAVEIIQRGLPCASSAEKRALVLFNSRPCADGLWKFSFHVHWPRLGIANIMKWKRFLSSLVELPRKLKWHKVEEKWHVEEDERIPIVDLAVYGGQRQLFRGPFCGKQGNGEAALFPLTFKESESGQLVPFRKHFSVTDLIKYILDARISRWPTGLTMIDFEDTPLNLGSAVQPQEEVHMPASARLISVERESPLMDFLEPILIASVVPKWQEKRKRDLLNLASRGAVVPVANLKVTKNIPHHTKEGVRHMIVEGDTFCMMDEHHVHSQSRDVIGITVDLVKARIRQSCFACGAQSDAFNFLHANNRIDIVEKRDCAFTFTTFFQPLVNPHQFILDYYRDLFLLQRGTRTVWVFDRKACVWRNDVSGNVVVGQLIDELNARHLAYLGAYKQIVVNRQVYAWRTANPQESDPVEAAAVNKIYNKAREFMKKNTPFIKLGAAARAKAIEDIRSYTIHHETREMNVFPHLIPMKNRMCVNVFNGEVKEMRQEHLFTSCVNAEIITTGEETREMNAWFVEIASGDQAKASYLKKFAAYSFTYLTHDRKMVILVGCGKNGKGAYKQFIMDISKGPEGFDSRCKNLLQNFWDLRGNSNTGPENPTPESYELLNKTFFYTDDIQDIRLDANKIKRMVAAEEATGRTLWGKPVDIKPKGKILWTSNFDPNGPGNDNAYWERQVIVKMLTKYVPGGEPIDPSRFRFRQDHVRYTRLLEMRDAFFTVAVLELVAYYQTLEWDAEKQQPAVFSSFPLPKCIEEAVQEARAQQLPLAAFMKEYTKPAPHHHPLEYVAVEDLFSNYMIHLENVNEQKTKRETTQASFVRLLASALDIHCTSTHVEGKILAKKVVRRPRENADYVSGDHQFWREAVPR